MSESLRDVKAAFRALVRDRAFSSVAIATLALGIAGTTIVFSLVNSIILRPLAYREPHRLVSIMEVVPELSAAYPRLPVNARHFDQWRTQCKSFDGMSLIDPESKVLGRAGEPLKTATARVSANFFTVLGAPLQLGRNFLNQEDRPRGSQVAIMTDSLWTGRFNRDPGILGKPIYLDGLPYTVIGILGPDFRPPVMDNSGMVSLARDTNVFMPAAFDLDKMGLDGEFNYQVVARLKPGVTVAQSQAELNVVTASIAKQLSGPMHLRAALTPLTEEVSGGARSGLIMLLGSVGAVLLIVCVNLANLSLARGVARNREFAIRTALGAGRWEIVRRTMTDSVLMSLIGGALGVALAWGGLQVLLHYAPIDLPRLGEVAMDGRVLSFAFALAALAGIIFGSLPAWQTSKADPQDALRAGSHTITEGLSGVRTRDALVTLEVGLGVVLVTAAALLVVSFLRLLRVDKGFQAENVIAATVNLPEATYKEDKDRELFYRQLVAKLQGIPGVRSAAVVSQLPLAGETWVSMIIREGDKRPESQQITANYRFISPEYFRTMGIPMLRGRSFEEGDRSRNLTVISERVAKQIWPGEDPVGKRFGQGNPDEPLFEIAGVVKDVRAGMAADPPLTIYTPYWYRNRNSMTVVLRTAMEPGAMAPSIQSAIWSLNRDVAIADVRTMDRVVSDSVARRRFQMYLIAGFAVFALLLASLGIFGVVSWTVARRRNEMGVRMALGASSIDVLRIVLSQGMRPVAVGLAAGCCRGIGARPCIKRSVVWRKRPRSSDPRRCSCTAGRCVAICVLCAGQAGGASESTGLAALRVRAKRCLPAGTIRLEDAVEWPFEALKQNFWRIDVLK